jgi:hypothetical protein
MDDKTQLGYQHAIIKLLVNKLGGDTSFTREEFEAAQNSRLQMIRAENLVDWRFYVQEIKEPNF